MAQKRMVSDNICDTVTFTEMSASARALYLHLHCASDEDGCCSGAKVLKSAKLRNSALDELITNGYAIPLVNTPPKERIVYLTDWHSLNRFHHELNTTPMYRTQLLETIPDIQNALFKAKNDPVFAPSIGKFSKGKSSIGESSVVEVSQEKVRTAELSTGNVSIDNESIDKPSTNNVSTYSHDNNIPTLDLVINELMSTYYLTTTEAQEVANAFITYNIGKGWKGLKSKSWPMLLKQFIGYDKRFTPEKIESRKAEAQERAEELRREQEQQAERERIEQERKAMFRISWQEKIYINTAQDLLEYIKGNHFSEDDYSLCSCLYDKLYVSHTLEEIMLWTLFDKGIINYDEVSDYVELNDYGINHASEPIKEIAEQIKNESYSDKYKPKLPELPKNDVPKVDDIIDDWQT